MNPYKLKAGMRAILTTCGDETVPFLIIYRENREERERVTEAASNCRRKIRVCFRFGGDK
jgi:hypothetical protein